MYIKEEYYKKAFEGATNGIAIVSLKGQWLLVNDGLCNMLGYTKKEFTKLTFQDLTHPDDLEAVLNRANDVISNRKSHYQMENRYFHKNGKVVYTILSVVLVRNADDKPLQFVSQIYDVTSIKLAEKHVSSLLEVTENQNKRLLNFAQIVSHNLSSHTSNLNMLLNLMEEEIPKATKNEYFPLLKTVTNNLKQTIEHLNQVALIHSDSKKQKVTVNLSIALEKAIMEVREHLIQTSGEIKNTVNKDVLVWGFSDYIDIILTNVLANAIKYRSNKRPLKIHIDAKIEEPYVVLSITDNGLGIDLEKHGDRLFGMYKTFHDHEDSRGIGLYITKNRIESIDGKIEAESKVDSGSTFYLYFLYE